MLISGKIMSK